MKLCKGTLSLYLNHLLAVFVTFALIFGFYNFAENNPFSFSAITAVIYFMFMYSAAWRIGDKDGRKIPGYYPDKKMPIFLSLLTAIIPLLLLFMRIAFPDALYVNIPLFTDNLPFFVGNCFLSGTPDLIFRSWFMSFAAFIKNDSIFAYFLQLFVLPIIIFAGYYVGTKRFRLTAYILPQILFQKDKKK